MRSLLNNISKRRFFYLLIALILLIFISPYLMNFIWGNWVLAATTFLTLLAIVFTMLEDKRLFALSCICAVIILLSKITQLYQPDITTDLVNYILTLFFYLFAIGVIFNQILQSQDITYEIIFGALCIYLLIGVSYSNVYFILELLSPGSFAINSDALSGTITDGFNLIYFSFTTLTTVGFGDIIPVTVHAKSIVIVEQITGVLYLAALVSRLVSGMSRKG